MLPMYNMEKAFLCFALMLCYLAKISTANDSLLIGSFNIQILGKTKMSKPDVVAVLVEVLSRYDLCIVQEIRDAEQQAFSKLVADINNRYNDSFAYITSERTGSSSSKEQYGFIFKKNKLEIRDKHQYEDKADGFERPPFVVRFKRLHYQGPLEEFTYIPLHAKPSAAVEEMNQLVLVYEQSTTLYGPDAIIAGDFNADCSYVCKSCWEKVKLRSDERFHWMIPDGADTTTKSTDCAYDRIVLAGDDLRENACCAGVYRFDLEGKLDGDLVTDVSDHYPVEFILQ